MREMPPSRFRRGSYLDALTNRSAPRTQKKHRAKRVHERMPNQGRPVLPAAGLIYRREIQKHPDLAVHMAVHLEPRASSAGAMVVEEVA